MSLPAFSPALPPANPAVLAPGWPARPPVPAVLPEIACIAALGPPCSAYSAGLAAQFLSLAPLVAAGWPARPPVPAVLPPVTAVLPEIPCIGALGPRCSALAAPIPEPAPPALRRTAQLPPCSRERLRPDKVLSSRKSSPLCVFVGGCPLSGFSARRPARTLRPGTLAQY